jgi:hypothetical protein
VNFAIAGTLDGMTLSERLAAAERARAGFSSDDPAVAVSGTTTDAPRADVTILLSPQHTVGAVTPDPGVPRHAVCPTCGRTGELGLVDLARRTGDWACETCGTLWRITQR